MFGGSDSDVDEEFDDLDHSAATTVASDQSAHGGPSAASAEIAPGEMPAELLDAILGIINAELPPIASKCIDREAQRRYLASALGAPLTQFAEALKRKAVSELTGDRKKMQTELEELRADKKEFSSKREEQKAALLSEQRQRRALNDRNRDLESKIAELDSEIEQHKLTISSLMNKMRVAEVAEGDSEALREEISRLKEQIAEKDSALQAKEQENTAMAEKIAEFESAAALDAALEQRREAAGEAPAEAPAPAATRKRRGRPRKQQAYSPGADDTSAEIDSVDWLLPGGVPAGHVPHTSDPDFGYQPPKHAPAPDSDAQLTLF